MSLAMQAVQQALITKLTGDALLMDRLDAVYDTVPQGSAMPYLVVDELTQETRHGLGEEVWQVSVVLEVWSEPQGRKPNLVALERLHGLLHHGSLSISGYSLREMRVEGASCVLAEQATRMVGTLEVTLVVAVT
jgi:hypothetical protein